MNDDVILTAPHPWPVRERRKGPTRDERTKNFKRLAPPIERIKTQIERGLGNAPKFKQEQRVFLCLFRVYLQSIGVLLGYVWGNPPFWKKRPKGAEKFFFFPNEEVNTTS